MQGKYQESRRRTRKASTPKKTTRKPIGTMNLILILVAILLILFTVEMIKVFREYGTIPDTLCTCVFACLGGECGVMGWIKVTKERRQDRRWTLQDRQAERQALTATQETEDTQNV